MGRAETAGVNSEGKNNTVLVDEMYQERDRFVLRFICLLPVSETCDGFWFWFVKSDCVDSKTRHDCYGNKICKIARLLLSFSKDLIKNLT